MDATVFADLHPAHFADRLGRIRQGGPGVDRRGPSRGRCQAGLIVAPLIAIGVFWIVHILPEKIAEKRKHPQAKAIKALCMLSLVFGGLLWPIAWLWAYSKPVLYKLAYGTDQVEPEHGSTAQPAEGTAEAEELKRLRAKVFELETRLAGSSAEAGERG